MPMNQNDVNREFIKKVQRWLGVTADGLAGPQTDRAWAAKTAPVSLKPSQRAIDLIHSFEQFRVNAYKDPGSRDGLPITIGWGSTSDLNGNKIKLGDVWTREYADRKFASDLEKFSAGVASAIGGAPTTQNQFDAMVSLAYNIGVGAFGRSTLLKRHISGDYRGAEEQFHVWRMNDGKPMAGLVRRRKQEAELYAAA